MSADPRMPPPRAAPGASWQASTREAVWLRQILTGREAAAQDVRADAERQGYSWRTVQRARRAVGVVTVREGFGRGAFYVWSLPAETPARQD